MSKTTLHFHCATKRMVIDTIVAYLDDTCKEGRHDSPGQPRFLCPDCMKNGEDKFLKDIERLFNINLERIPTRAKEKPSYLTGKI